MRGALLAVLTCSIALATAQAASPGTETPSTEDCSINAEGNGSQDCVREFKVRFYALAKIAGVHNAKHSHYAEFPGVALSCNGDKPQGKPDFSPINSITCGANGENQVVASGYALFQLSRSCVVDGVNVPLVDSLAAIAAHELAHLALQHTEQKKAVDGEVCSKWATTYFESSEGAKWLADQDAELNRLGLTQTQAQARFNSKATDLCFKKAAKELADRWKPYEAQADREAQIYLRQYGGHEMEAAYVCAMKGIQDMEWVESANLPPHPEHPEAAERVQAARLLRLQGMAQDFCRKDPKNFFCNLASLRKKKDSK